MKWRALATAILAGLAGFSAWAVGPSPRYLEELCIGGGHGDAQDGGANLERDGDIVSDGTICAETELKAGKNDGADHAASVLAGTGNSALVNLRSGDSTHGGALWFDGARNQLFLGTRNGASVLTEALGLTPGSADLRLYGRLLEPPSATKLSTEGLLGLWHCENSVTAPDWSGHEDAATKQGTGVSAVTGKYGTALSFTGTGFLQAGTTIASTYGATDVTYSAWFKADSGDTYRTIVGYYEWAPGYKYFRIALHQDNTLHAGASDGTTTLDAGASASVTDGNWHHAAATYDASTKTLKLYLDGAYVGASTNAAYTGAAGAYPFCIGSLFGAQYFNGSIDEVVVFGRALNANEIKSLYALNQELSDPFGAVLVNGALTIKGDATAESGGLAAGKDSTTRGMMTVWDGAGGSAPGCVRLASPNGTLWYLFVEDDGTLKIHSALPTQNNNGYIVGTQF